MFLKWSAFQYGVTLFIRSSNYTFVNLTYVIIFVIWRIYSLGRFLFVSVNIMHTIMGGICINLSFLTLLKNWTCVRYVCSEVLLESLHFSCIGHKSTIRFWIILEYSNKTWILVFFIGSFKNSIFKRFKNFP